MWMQFDQFAKSMLERLLRPVGTVRPQHEVRSSAQAVDMWFEPAPGREAARSRLGPLGRISEEACMLEPFHEAPGVPAVRACIRKQYNLAHWQEQDVRAAVAQEARAAAAQAFPRLWLLSAGRPETVLARYEMRPMDGWLAGFWQAAEGHALHVVVLRDLPETRETVLLRLLGAGATHSRAIKELAALPRDAPERALAVPLLQAFRIQIPPGVYLYDQEDDMEYTEALERLYAEWEQQVQQKSREQGMEQGMHEAFVTVYHERFGQMSDDVRAALALVHDKAAFQRLMKTVANLGQDQVDAMIRAAAAEP
jgi:hypothetical protein